MSDISDRYRKAARRFGETVRSVPADKWDATNPCEGWVNRDVVKHLVEWVPAFFSATWGLAPPAGPSADADPMGAWEALDGWLQSNLDNAEVAGALRDTPMGSMTFEGAFDMIALSDVVIHTWDLARGAGLDETLDDAEVQRLLGGQENLSDEMRGEHFGPRVDLAADASDQDKMLAFFGRHP